MSDALRLAHELILAMKDTDAEHWDTLEEAAAELRRLHEAHDWQYRMAGDRLRRIEKLQMVNEELLGALEEYVNADPVDDALNPRKRKARAAIAKAGGEA